ncbi:MAG: group II intron reverse transcriptase/maturase [Chloroflexi bacterium]|nr:group II intron reverse transcriptase/maturase [Chloroflexota bacterium]
MDASTETLLQRALEPHNLRLAWEEVADNQGIPGVDRVSIRAWRRNWEERLVQLSRAIRSNAYRPKPLRLRRIPKSDRRLQRILRIPTVTDRVLQRAVLQALYPVCEPRFLDCSFGYRPGVGLKDAVEHILVLRENGFRHLLDADIDDFFNSVDHAILIEFLQADLPDGSLFPLIKLWLECGRSQPEQAAGIPMGSPLSPLFANVYLHRLDQVLLDFGYHPVRYADDFIVCVKSPSEAETVYHQVEAALEVLKLRFEPAKTRLTSFDLGFEFIGVHFEGDAYSYTWQDKEIQVSGDQVDWLFGVYGPQYH